MIKMLEKDRSLNDRFAEYDLSLNRMNSGIKSFREKSTENDLKSNRMSDDAGTFYEKPVEHGLKSNQMSDDNSLHDRFAEQALCSNRMNNDDKSLHEKFVEYGTNAKEWMRRCVFLLPEIEKRRIWEKKGFSSIFEYAAKLAGMSHEKVIDALRILQKIQDKPEIKKIAMEKGINSIRPIIAIVTKENEKFWAEKAKVMSRNTLSVFVKGLRSAKNLDDPYRQAIFGENGRTGPSKTSRSDLELTSSGRIFQQSLEHSSTGKTIIYMDLNPEIALKLEKLKSNGSWDDLMKEFIEMREKRLESEKQEIIRKQKIKNDKNNKLEAEQCDSKKISRHIPNAIKKHVIAKTNGTCAFPGCKKPMEILHHTKRFALASCVAHATGNAVSSNANDGNAFSGNAFVHHPDFIAPLCKEHERLAHLGLIENEDMPPEKWKIREKPDQNYIESDVSGIDKIVNKFRNPALFKRKLLIKSHD